VAEAVEIAVTGPAGGIPWAWWATRWQLRRQRAVAHRLTPNSGKLDKRIGGVIIGGGNDIDPAIYGGDVSSSPSVDPERDNYELEILAEADRRQLPVLGICRGAQLINVHLGGTLFGDLARHRRHTSNRGTLLPRKDVTIMPDSILAEWIGATTSSVNSLHHQAVEKTGNGLQIAAHDRDGIVQAIESTSGPLRIGVQWHPEYLPQRRDHRQLFACFVAACRDS
jgi:putative glutamine amidotransferase